MKQKDKIEMIKREWKCLLESHALMLRELMDNKGNFDLTNEYIKGRRDGLIIMARDVLDNYLRFQERCNLK